MDHRHSAAKRQKGAATLLASIMLTALLTIVTLLAARFLVYEQSISGNQYRATQAFEAAQYGLDRGVAWLQARAESANLNNWASTNTTTCKENTAPGSSGVYSIYALGWSTSASNSGIVQRSISSTDPCNLNIPSTMTVTMGNIAYDVTVSYLQTISNIADIAFVKISATATSQDTTKGGKATVEQVLSIPGGPPATGGLADAGVVVKGCLSGVTGNPDICPSNVTSGNEVIKGAGSAPNCATGTGTTGVAVASLQNQPSDANTCIDFGKLTTHGGTRSFLNTPTATVWNTLFPNNRLTKQMVQTLAANNTPGFVYYNSGSAPNKIPAIGTAAQPVLVYVDSSAGCIPMAPGTFYALIYYETTANCDLQGGGAVDLSGSIATEGSITKFNANTIIRSSSFTGNWENEVAVGAKVFARVPGTWRDFQ